MSGPRGTDPRRDPDRPDVAQEEDRVDTRKAWLITAAATVVTIALCLAAWLLLRVFTGERLRPPEEVPAEAAAPTGAPPAGAPRIRGQPFSRRARPTPDSAEGGPLDPAGAYGWIDREAGVASVPVSVAMELLVLLESPGPGAGDAAGGSAARSPVTREPAGPSAADTARPGTDLSDTAATRRDVPDTSAAASPAGTHPVMSAVDVEPRPGTRLPLDVVFTDERGDAAPLGAAFTGERPVLLVPGWYRCRMLCGLVVDGLADAVAALDGREPGRDYEVVVLGIDPREGPADARERRERVRARLAEAGGAGAGDLPGWRFLTGPEGAAKRVADSLGFRYRYDPETDQYAHAAAVFAVSPTGTLTGTLYGVDPAAADVERALAGAAAEKPGLSLEKVLVRCFRYTPSLQRHAGLIANVLRGGGVLIVLGLAGVFVLAGRRATRREAA